MGMLNFTGTPGRQVAKFFLAFYWGWEIRPFLEIFVLKYLNNMAASR
jgi:hypothetical protein